MFEGLKKNWGKKTKKTKIFPRVPVTRHSGKRSRFFNFFVNGSV
jgi:hypothetical protein